MAADVARIEVEVVFGAAIDGAAGLRVEMTGKNALMLKKVGEVHGWMTNDTNKQI